MTDAPLTAISPGSPLGDPWRGPSFARGLWRIAAANASSGNTVELMRNGPRTFDVMIAAIDDARDTVALESYMFLGDSVGQRFADALGAAARRGVHVRVLADWVGSRATKRHFWSRLRAAGVHVRIFGRPGLRPWFGALPRDHRKLLVVDDRVGVTGGIGIGEAWSGIVRKRRMAPWRDTAVRIEGPAGTDMARAFAAMWRRAEGRERRRARRARRQLVRTPRDSGVDARTAAGAVVGIVEGEPWRLRIARALQLQSVSAERYIWIATAYFAPPLFELDALAGAARDGVDVRLLVPSSSDHPSMRRFARRTYRRLLRNGVRIWEWNGVMMHAKTSVVDGTLVRVGSTDFNPLGIALNYELDAIIHDAVIGQEATEMYLADLAESTEITERELTRLLRS